MLGLAPVPGAARNAATRSEMNTAMKHSEVRPAFLHIVEEGLRERLKIVSVLLADPTN